MTRVRHAMAADQFSGSSGFQPVRTLPLVSRPVVSG
jgi:hypothetical protein